MKFLVILAGLVFLLLIPAPSERKLRNLPNLAWSLLVLGSWVVFLVSSGHATLAFVLGLMFLGKMTGLLGWGTYVTPGGASINVPGLILFGATVTTLVAKRYLPLETLFSLAVPLLLIIPAQAVLGQRGAARDQDASISEAGGEVKAAGGRKPAARQPVFWSWFVPLTTAACLAATVLLAFRGSEKLRQTLSAGMIPIGLLLLFSLLVSRRPSA